MMDLGLSRTAKRLTRDGDDVWAVSFRADEIEQDGGRVLRLCVGDPDFATPDAIHAAVSDSLKRGRTHYSSAQGELELRKSIAGLENKTSRHSCEPEQVVVFPGATNALFAVLSCLLDTEDELVVPEPMYAGYRGIFDTVGCQVIHAPLNTTNNFALDIEKTKAAVNDKTRAVLVNTPGNPAGNMASAEQLEELAAFCLDRGVWLICDEVYSMLAFDQPHVSIRRAAQNPENIISINSLSKSHAMSGWRLGWVIVPVNLAPSMRNFNGGTLYGCPQFIQDAAACALRHDGDHVADMRDQYRLRRDYVVKRISGIPELQCQPPTGGMFVMADVSSTGLNGRQFALQLLEEQRVSLVPGDGFGGSTENFVRITLAQPVEVLSEAFDRIETFLQHRHLS
jgi:arginine:pyruvate transaminase